MDSELVSSIYWGVVYLIQKRNVTLLSSDITQLLIISFSFLRYYLNPAGTKKVFGLLHVALLHPRYTEKLDFIFSTARRKSGRKKRNGQRPSPNSKFQVFKTAINWNLWFTLKAVFEANSHINNSLYTLASTLLKNGISEKILPPSIKFTGKKTVQRLTLDNCCTFKLTAHRECLGSGFVSSSWVSIFNFELSFFKMNTMFAFFKGK